MFVAKMADRYNRTLKHVDNTLYRVESQVVAWRVLGDHFLMARNNLDFSGKKLCM